MTYGAYDDRNDARMNVKRWLSQNDAHLYSPDAIRSIVKDTVLKDKDPVDPIAVSWREGTYGAWMGLVEFAREEAAGFCTIDRTGSKGSVSLALLRDRSAAKAEIEQIRAQLERTTDMLGDPSRARTALNVAEELLQPAE
jgi:hypothetical protein